MGIKGRKSSECPQVADTAELAVLEIYPIKSHLHVVLYALRKHDNTELFRASSKRSILICCKKSKESGDRETLKSALYTLVFHTIILYTKQCRLILSTKDLFVLIAKKNLKLTETTEQTF